MTTPTTRTVCLTYFIHVDLLLCREAVIDHRTTKFTNHPWSIGTALQNHQTTNNSRIFDNFRCLDYSASPPQVTHPHTRNHTHHSPAFVLLVYYNYYFSILCEPYIFTRFSIQCDLLWNDWEITLDYNRLLGRRYDTHLIRHPWPTTYIPTYLPPTA